MSKQVFPQAPSPTMTSLRRSSAMLGPSPCAGGQRLRGRRVSGDSDGRCDGGAGDVAWQWWCRKERIDGGDVVGTGCRQMRLCKWIAEGRASFACACQLLAGTLLAG